MSIVYGIDIGQRNLAIAKMTTVDQKNPPVIEDVFLIDLGKGKLRFQQFVKFCGQHMLETGRVLIELQPQPGRNQNISYYILGYLEAMGHDCALVNGRTKFNVAKKLNLITVPNKTTYIQRKEMSVDLLRMISAILGFKLPALEKYDDVGDALLYALRGVYETAPSTLVCLDKRENVLRVDISEPAQ